MRGASRELYPKRLSATDISALASMKNVAKCDTWCELQNPVNHRVFERKLRPKPLGRGHVCLGVTQRRPLPAAPEAAGRAGRMMASRGRLAPRMAERRACGVERRDGRWKSETSRPVARESSLGAGCETL